MQILTRTHQFSHLLDRKSDLFGCVRVGNGLVKKMKVTSQKNGGFKLNDTF